jgi:hypothetical protein
VSRQSFRTAGTNKFVDRIMMIAASAHAPALGALMFVRVAHRVG